MALYLVNRGHLFQCMEHPMKSPGMIPCAEGTVLIAFVARERGLDSFYVVRAANR